MKALISQLREQWRNPKAAIHRGEIVPLELGCQFAEGATDNEFSGIRDKVPSDLIEFWKEAREANLFVDWQYGQWGLRIWSPARSMEKTRQLCSQSSAQLIDGDLLIGEFLGDTDLLLVRCASNAPDFNNVVIARGMDLRRDWPVPAATFAEFLSTYARKSGDKFWDPVGTRNH